MQVHDLKAVEPWAGPLPEGNRFRRMREELEWSRAHVSKLGEVSTDTIHRYETGETLRPSSLMSEHFRRLLMWMVAEVARRRALRKSHWEVDVDRLPFPVLENSHPLISGDDGGAARVVLQEFFAFSDEAMSRLLGLHPVTLWHALKGGSPLNERSAEGLGISLEPFKLALSAMWAAMEGIRAVRSA